VIFLCCKSFVFKSATSRRMGFVVSKPRQYNRHPYYEQLASILLCFQMYFYFYKQGITNFPKNLLVNDGKTESTTSNQNRRGKSNFSLSFRSDHLSLYSMGRSSHPVIVTPISPLAHISYIILFNIIIFIFIFIFILH
jgi:hypothetical protein